MNPASIRPRSTASSLCPTASALIALVAIAAMVTSAGSATPTLRSETRQSISEGAAVRAAVAAVAAAARELVGGDRLVNDMSAAWSLALGSSDALGHLRREERDAPSLILALTESLLDLPPPMR